MSGEHERRVGSTSFFTGSSFGARITSTWHGWDMYAARDEDRSAKNSRQTPNRFGRQRARTIDAAVSTVGAAALLHRLVDLDVLNNEALGVEALHLRP